MIFSVTELGTHARCERKAVLTSANGRHLQSMFSPLSLQTGSIVHKAHHLWIKDTDNKQSLEQHTMDAAVMAQDVLIAGYLAKVGTEPSDDEMNTLYESVDFCKSMARNYEAYYGGRKLPDGYKMIAPEQNVRIKVKGTSHYLQGRLDAFILDLATGRPGVLERKTYNQRTKLETLKRNRQFIRYSWLQSQLPLGFNDDEPPFILYDGLWRRHVPPKGKKMEDLFTQHRFTPTKWQLAEETRFLPKKLNAMAFMYEHPELAEPHVPWLGCTDCDFAKKDKELCDAISANRQDMIKYFLDNKFTQRTDDVEDSEDDSAD